MKKIKLQRDKDNTDSRDWVWIDPKGGKWQLERLEGNHWQIYDPDGELWGCVDKLKKVKELVLNYYLTFNGRKLLNSAGAQAVLKAFNRTGYMVRI